MTFADGPEADYSTILPLLTARGLVAQFAVPRALIGQSGRLTEANLHAMESAGMEIACHSRTHTPDPADFAAFTDETVTAANEMRAMGLNIRMMCFPGEWVTAYPAGYFVTDSSFYGSAEDLLLRANFDAYQCYIPTTPWTLPVDPNLRWGHIVSTVDTNTLAQAIAKVDAVAGHSMGTQFGVHTAALDRVDHLTTAEFTTLLDYIAAKKATRELSVLTPTALRLS